MKTLLQQHSDLILAILATVILPLAAATIAFAMLQVLAARG